MDIDDHHSPSDGAPSPSRWGPTTTILSLESNGYRRRILRRATIVLWKVRQFVSCWITRTRNSPQSSAVPSVNDSLGENLCTPDRLTQAEIEADTLGSFNEAMAEVARRYKAGESLPNSGYFKR